MKFDTLFHGKLIKRYKRFLADIVLDDGQLVIAHVPNSGAMTSTIADNCDVWVTYHDNPKRKLKYTLELTKIDNQLICVNTSVANKISAQAIEMGVVKELAHYPVLKTEQKYGKNSRIDILLEEGEKKCYVEVKSVTLKVGDALAFPDSITSRGEKHLRELELMVQEGHRAVMLYVIQRTDKLPFRIADEIDEKYYKTFCEVTKKGVEILVYQSHIDLEEVFLERDCCSHWG